MRITNFKAKDRGTADFGWLKANYAFSFANYYDRDKMNFGALRVLNDDVIQGGMGFGEHPHDNMEIITIPLHGALAHKDSMTETWIPIEVGEVQVMSAGKGIVHAEKNNSTTEDLKLFQIWIIPEKLGVTPTYKQMKFDAIGRKNQLQTLVTSYTNNEKDTLKIHQNAKISRLYLDAGLDFNYNLMTEKHGVYVLLVSGEAIVNNEILGKRDAIGIENTSNFNLQVTQNSELLFIEVPMVY